MIIYPEKAEIRKENRKKLSFMQPETYQIKWEELVATKHGYEEFANFLEKELATENLLYVTEVFHII